MSLPDVPIWCFGTYRGEPAQDSGNRGYQVPRFSRTAIKRSSCEIMRREPNFAAEELATVLVPVAVVHSEHDEFIERVHAEYLARSVLKAQLIGLPRVPHFAPLQRPKVFNNAMP